MDWKRILGYISGSVNEELLSRIEYLVSENRILRGQIKGRILLSDAERKTLAEIGKRLGKRALEEIASIVKPDTILGWHRQLIARKFDGSKTRTYPGRPRTEAELERLIVRMAQENRSWGYDRIVGALVNLGYRVSDNTVGNILKRNGLAPAPERKKTTTWKEFIRTHRDLLFGTDCVFRSKSTTVSAAKVPAFRSKCTSVSGICTTSILDPKEGVVSLS